jgi:hypothetical protein
MSHNQKYEIERILNSPDRGITETRGIGGIVARLWRTILSDLNIRPGKFELLLTEFIINAKSKVADDRVSKLFTRGNLRRELERPTMTIKVFMKGIKMLRVTKFKIAVELEFSNGKKTLHSTSVDLGEPKTVNDLFSKDHDE